MALDKAIASGKERRKPYWDSRACDYTCRSHGGCPWCANSRTRWRRKLAEQAAAELDAIEQKGADHD